MLFVLLNPKEDCFVKIKISLFIITKENVSLITCDYVIINLTLLNVDHLWWASFNLLCSSPATVASLRGRLVLLLLSCVFILSLKVSFACDKFCSLGSLQRTSVGYNRLTGC